MKALFVVIVAIACLVHPPDLSAQYVVRDGVFVSGGGVRSGSNIVYDCVGQAIVGVSSGGSYIDKSGFWYVAGLSSAVDVAVVSFAADVLEEGVRLEWELSPDKSFGGVNVYRAEIVSGSNEESLEYERLTEEPINSIEVQYTDDKALPGRSYVYRIGVIAGEVERYSPELKVKLPPKPLTLYQNHPNPFNPSTRIRYFLPEATRVRLEVFDTSGRLVKQLFAGNQEAGRYEVVWDGTNDRGKRIGSGVYFYRLLAGKKAITKKLVMVR